MSATPVMARPGAWHAASRGVYLSALLLLCVYAGGQLRQSLQLRVQDAPALPSPAVVPPEPSVRDSPLSALADMHLFGEYREPQPAVEPPPLHVTEAPPGLRLQGVFTSSESVRASALIAVEGGAPARRFQPGDAITPQAELVSVALDHVLLRTAGEVQRLSLHRGSGAKVHAPVPANSSRPRAAVRGSGTRGVTYISPRPDPGRAAVVMARLSRLRAGGG
jgi:hypothetical protein